jgi:hypothetical protein
MGPGHAVDARTGSGLPVARGPGGRRFRQSTQWTSALVRVDRRLAARHHDLVAVGRRGRDEYRRPGTLRRSAFPAEGARRFDHLRFGGSAAGHEAQQRSGHGERDPPDHNSIVGPGTRLRKRAAPRFHGRRGETLRQRAALVKALASDVGAATETPWTGLRLVGATRPEASWQGFRA